MRKYIPRLNFHYAIKVMILFGVYYLTAKIGLSFYAVHGFATTVWPPTGIALAFLLLYGYNLWPGVALAAFLVNFSTSGSILLALGIGLGNTMEAIVGTYLLRKYVVLYRCFERLHDTLYFIGIIALFSSTISATAGSLTLLLKHIITGSEFASTWLTWWIGDTLGAFVLTPFLITHLAPTRPWNYDKLRSLEIIGGYAFVIFSGLLVFWYPLGNIQHSPLMYLILFPLLWGGLRFGSRGMTSSILLISIIAVVSTAYGRGPFILAPLDQGLLFLQIFLGTISVTFLIFLSIVKERKLVMDKLEGHVTELEHVMKKISSADQAKNDFLAILAHELRNPLAPVLSSLELMRIRIKENVDVTNLVRTVETHVHTMSHLLDDLLDISRISKRKLKLEKENFSLQDVIEKSIETVEPSIQAKKHTLTADVPEKTVWLYGDPLRVEQVIVNMLVNAAKYTAEGGNINIMCEQEMDTISIRVRDNGIGIAPEMLPRIFEPFLQANKDKALSGGGLGIGLSLAKKLVELHDGVISASSGGIGLGSEFTVTLPLPQNVQLPMQMGTVFERPIPVNNTAPKKFKILVVDDNVAAALGLSELLIHKGHSVETTHTGMDALELLTDFSPHIIILDIGLPHMNGYEVAKKIREQFQDSLTLIALTGYGQEEDKIKATRAGFNFHLTKPISIVDIEKIINNL
jgi:signal transduction histidine kinase/CheY-like chemotaxis protein